MFDFFAVGELNVDLVLGGLKRFPETGRETLANSCTECMGSSTAICACAASSLGLKTGFFGKLGNDRRGEVVLSEFARYGVDVSRIQRRQDYTTGLTVSINMARDRALVTYLGDTIDCLSPEDIPVESLDTRHLHVGSYFLQTRLHGGLTGLFRRAHAAGMTTSLDAGWDESERWMRVMGDVLSETDFFLPNEREAEQIAGTSDMELAAERIAAMGCGVAIKCGERGALFREPNGKTLHCAGHRVAVVDTTGAGDSFNAGFLYAFLQGGSMRDCLEFGNATGAVSVEHPGGTSHCPTLREVEAMLRS